MTWDKELLNQNFFFYIIALMFTYHAEAHIVVVFTLTSIKFGHVQINMLKIIIVV